MKDINVVIKEVELIVDNKFGSIVKRAGLDILKKITIQSFLGQIPFHVFAKMPSDIRAISDQAIDLSALGGELIEGDDIEICKLIGVMFASCFLDRNYKILPTALSMQKISGPKLLEDLTDSIFNISIS